MVAITDGRGKLVNLSAAAKHEWQRLTRFLTKTVWRDFLQFATWPLVSVVLRVLGRFSPYETPGTRPKNHALVLEGGESSFVSGRVRGQNLTSLLHAWLSETVGVRKTSSSTQVPDFPFGEEPDVIVVTYDWLLDNQHVGLRSAARVAFQARGLGVPVFVVLPDGFWLRLTANSSLLVAIAGGSQIILQDTQFSHRKFGTVKPSAPHFWTWPPSHAQAWQASMPWSSRARAALIAGSGGGEYRKEVGARMEKVLGELGYAVSTTAHYLSWEDYLVLHKSSRVVVTTCRIHPTYLRGPKFYQRRIPPFAVTGRVWEAFASENVLVTDDNPVLSDLGFLPGTHFVPLPAEDHEWDQWEMPAECELKSIARAGHELFLEHVMVGDRS